MSTNKNTVKLYWQEVRHHKKSFFTALVFVPTSALLLDTLLPFFLSQAVSELTTHRSEQIITSLSFAAIIGVGGVLANFIGFRSLIHHEGHIRTRLYNATFRSLLNKDQAFFVNEKVGALTSRFIDFIRSHVALQDLFILRTLGFFFSLTVGLSLVAHTSPLLAGILFLLIISILVEIRLFTKIRKPYRHERKKLIGEIHGEVADSLTNNLLVKTFAHEKSEIDYLEKQTKRLEKIYIKDIGLFTIDGAIRNFIMVITQIIGIGICTYLVLNDGMNLGIAIFAIAYLQRIAAQIFMLGEIVNGYDEALLQAAPMSDILMHSNVVNDTHDAKPINVSSPTINLNNVSYRYSDSPAVVLENIQLAIPAGQKVGLVGHSGAGKTTIVQLLLRFSDVTSGEITISDQDIKTITQKSLRENIAYVPQEPMLFHRTLRENIAYGKQHASDSEIRHAAKQANALEFIEQLPDGLDTLVGERGVKLSGGQRQRIAIARAILKDAPILVLDEATSALDSESEKLIQASLETLMKGRTSIVIAHRLSTIAKLDRIVVLENGKIIEDGRHAELLKIKNGTYARLWNHQSGGFIDE
ncbi:MAG: putative transporter ATP-binding protein [Candidatus Saccharibacteria bacterium]|nr:putative transporter ATP-binding protein [Candidatus Saccharibacteria bacterium]